ncbi:hypothetical protein MSPP1_000481 [Malassezia sp. CBS 17886]|nr:hypothetical protein MSPP1_000481 [Malassezia sp. CBS 17886]
MDATPSRMLPGQPLPFPPSTSVQPGAGTYAHDGCIVASRVGSVSGDDERRGKRRTVSVLSGKVPLVVPGPESVIIGRITRVTPRQATVSILVVDGTPCGGMAAGLGARTNHAAGEGIEGMDFQGVVRAQDLRSTEKDSVVMSECFRPGDIVRATVISLGDARSYYLSTAANDLGVIYAMSSVDGARGWHAQGRPMQPVSWREMSDENGVVERRKCAKPEWV